ncbi:MAG: 16S rRNA processing protein RimM [Paracoccaceae bacterium]|jgi:16S rRNA processing protein RimM
MTLTTDLIDDPERICVGAVAGAFGVRGEVRVKSFCAQPEAIGSFDPLTDDTGTKRFELTLMRPVKGGYAARMSGVVTREDAEALRGLRLFAPRASLPSLPDDEFYHADLVGLEVVDTGGKRLGTVRAVHDFGAGDLLEILGGGLRQSVMLPFTKDAVPTVDLAAGRIVADPPLGIFPEDDKDAADKDAADKDGADKDGADKDGDDKDGDDTRGEPGV